MKKIAVLRNTGRAGRRLLAVALVVFGYGAGMDRIGMRAGASGAVPPSAHNAAALAPRAQEVTFGRSLRGRPLRASVLGAGPDVTLVIAGVHGNERSAPGVLLRLKAYLAAHPAVLGGRRVVLAPDANPDGWAARTRVNARGVDLNRNLPQEWRPGGHGTRHNAGAMPLSEPETRALVGLIQTYRPAKVISIHAPLHCLNWTGAQGQRLARAMQRENHYPAREHIGYPTPGSLGLYCGVRLGLGMVTLELPRGSADAAWKQNRAALIAAIRFR